jgi:hypothetical protein
MGNKVYKFADIVADVSYETDYIPKQCRDYVSSESPELNISVTAEDVEVEKGKQDAEGYPYGYLESLAFYRKFCNSAVHKDVLLFHSSAISVDGRAYLFAAPSGTGKSTHARLWRQMFGDRAVMINDDKPLIKPVGDILTVYGTPWDGKHKLSSNTSVTVAGICFLARGKENHIKRLSPMEAIPEFLSQTYRPEDEEGVKKMLELSVKITSSVPMYRLECNISDEAVRVAYEEMSGNKFN